METPGHISALRVVGGNLALDFANTFEGGHDDEAGVEHLRGYGDLVAWGWHVGLIPEPSVRGLLRLAGERPSEAEVAYARSLELRGVLYGIFLAVARGEAPSSKNLEALRLAECDALAHARFAPGDGGFGWEWPEDGDLGAVVWPVVHAAVELLTSGELGRVKVCAACRWLFVDRSKNRSRRWCTMEECGTHEKMRRYVARRAARRDGRE